MNNVFAEFLTGESILIGEERPPDKIQTELFSDDDIKNNISDEQENRPPKVNTEYELLKEKSANSVLMKHIQIEELNQLKIENERISILKNAGNVAELKFIEFLYFGYMEKANLDLMRMVKKLKVIYEPLVSKEHLKEVVDILEKEISYVLKSIKKKQAEEVKSWKDGL